MKRYLSHILIFISFCYLNLSCMDQNQEQNRFLVCNQIKQISPNASWATYLELAKKLSENNLSTCACITYLMQKREKKVIELIKKDFVSEETENTINELYEQQQQKDANEKNGIPLTIHVSPSIDPDTQAHIIEKFSGKYRTTIVPAEKFCPCESDACVERPVVLYKKKDDSDFFKLTKLKARNPKLGINSSFKKLSLNARNAAIAHEEHHLEKNHSILQALWTSSLRNNRRYQHRGRRTFDEKEEEILAKLDRAYEAAADRIPAACNDCKLASDFLEDIVEHCKNSNLISGFIAKISNYLVKKNKLFQSHPSNEKRLLWAQRIYNLKLAEQELKKSFET